MKLEVSYTYPQHDAVESIKIPCLINNVLYSRAFSDHLLFLKLFKCKLLTSPTANRKRLSSVFRWYTF